MAEDDLYGNAGDEDPVAGRSLGEEEVHEPPFGTTDQQPDHAESNLCAGCGEEEIPVHRTRCEACLDSPPRKSTSDNRPGKRARELAVAAAADEPDPRTQVGDQTAVVPIGEKESFSSNAVVTKKRRFHRVVLVVVHAKSHYFAAVNARAALDRRGGRWQPPKDRAKESYKTVANAEDVDDVVREDWGPLPNETKATSKLGVELLEEAWERTIWDEDIDEDELLTKRVDDETVTEPYIYGPGGEAICSRADLTALLNGDLKPAYEQADRLWIVPALVFKFEYEGAGEYERELECPRCNPKTQQVFLDHERSHPQIQKRVPVWMCTECELLQNGPEPGRED